MIQKIVKMPDALFRAELDALLRKFEELACRHNRDQDKFTIEAKIAADICGESYDSLRKASARGSIASEIIATDHGPRRCYRLQDLTQRRRILAMRRFGLSERPSDAIDEKL